MDEDEKSVNFHELLNSIKEERMWSLSHYGGQKAAQQKEKMDRVLKPLFKTFDRSVRVRESDVQHIVTFVNVSIKDSAIVNNSSIQTMFNTLLILALKSLVLTEKE